MKASVLQEYLEEMYQIPLWSRIDSSMNGLQVGRKDKELGKIAFAVDACMETFRGAKAQGADALFVHHGLYWGRPIPITDQFYDRVKYLIEEDLVLFALHLPLDAHPEVGNNSGMAGHLGLENIEPFGEYKGKKIGFNGTLPVAMTIEDLKDKLFGAQQPVLNTLAFGPKEIRSVGLISGGAPYEVSQAIDEGLDLYITGDAQHAVYHSALEAGINVIFGGHYATETWGVRLLAKRLADEFALETVFIDQPTGL
jgi:dinuclear metal center YbgI/SA1388 family protein